MTAPGQTVGVSVFVDRMIDALALSRSQLSGTYFVGTLVGAASLPAVDRWLDRVGLRRLTTVVAAAFGAFLTAMSGVGGLAAYSSGSSASACSAKECHPHRHHLGHLVVRPSSRGAVGLSSAVGQALMFLSPLALAAGIAAFG